jgi:hypothetical protein
MIAVLKENLMASIEENEKSAKLLKELTEISEKVNPESMEVLAKEINRIQNKHIALMEWLRVENNELQDVVVNEDRNNGKIKNDFIDSSKHRYDIN